MNFHKSVIGALLFCLICNVNYAQTDSSFLNQNKTQKSSFIDKWKLPKVTLPKVHLHPIKIPTVSFLKIKNSRLHFDSLKHLFPNVNMGPIYFSAGINFSKQTISGFDYTIPFNYDVTKINNDAFKPGYFIGGRWEGVIKNKHLFNLEMGLNKISSGTKYTTTTNLDPFIGDFVQHKADDQLFTLNIGANYKKLLPITKNEKLKFYALIGPSFDIRLSNQSINNRVTNSYKKILMRANFGLEFDNNGYYTIFMHYKPSISSFTKQPINTSLNSFELGMMLNADDIF